MMRGGAGRIGAALVALGVAVALSGCANTDPLAEQFRNGGQQNYISGDGANTVIAEANRDAPVEFAVELADGTPLNAEDLRGSVVVVNFWYSSCPPCRLEAPELAALATEYADANVRFLGVNVYDGAPAAAAFEKTFGIPYPSVLDVETGAMRLAFAGSVPPNAVPVTLVLDARGRVAARISGIVSEPSILRGMIDDRLAEATS